MARGMNTIRALQRDALRRQFVTAGVTRKQVKADLKRTTRYPRAIEVSYAGFVVGSQRKINAELRRRLESIATILDTGRRVDSPSSHADDLSDDIIAAFQALRETIQRLTSATDGILRLGITAHGSKTAQFNDDKYATPTMRLLGIGNASAGIERSIVRGWVAENVGLITNMNAEQVGKFETLFLRALRDGSRSRQIQNDVSAILRGSEQRARLIARDQIGKLNGQLDRQKQTSAGLDSYIWRGALDERERKKHVEREGKRYYWARPPEDGHPGQPVQCRCSPEPDLEALLGPEFAPEPTTPADFALATDEARAKHRREQAQKRRRRAKRAARAVAA